MNKAEYYKNTYPVGTRIRLLHEVYSNIKKFKDYDPQYERLIEVENDEEAIIHAGNYKIRCNEETAIGRAFLL